MTDARGCSITGATPRALELYEYALWQWCCHRGAPLAAARAAVREAPEFVAARQLEAWILLCGRHPVDAEAAGWAYARLHALPMNARERAHAAAIAAALDGECPRSGRLLDLLVADAPQDLVALAVGHSFDHLLGNVEAQARRTDDALACWSPDLPGYHAVLSMHAFALEESGDYRRAEEAARRALELEPRDIRAHHAVAHVYEMTGQPEAGIRWMGARAQFWGGAGPSSTHLWWHLALYHLARGNPRHALEIYDRRIESAAPALSELIDASALLWRLELRGARPGARWQSLAEQWAPRAADAHCAFNDLHAMLAFTGARRTELAEELLAAQERAAARPGVIGEMTRLVGEPACRSIDAFGRGRYLEADSMLRRLPPVAYRIGGSQAQRDVLELTRFTASRMREAA